MESGMNQESSPEDKSTKMAQDLFMNLKLNDESKEREPYESKEEFIEVEDAAASEEEDDEDGDTEEEFSFSLVYDEANTSPITADDAFANGQIKPIFPLFNQHLLLKEGMVMEDLIANDRLPNVKKVFVEADSIPATASTSTSTSGNGDVTGSYYYEWENKAVVEVAPDGCKKSNSTGFSKIWRFRDLMHRSSSDGRDAFVFLDNNTASSGTTIISKSKEEPAVVRKAEKKKTVAESTVNGDKAKVNPAGEKSKVTKAKKLVKSKTTVASAHEVYLKSKAKEQERRRSYLPYRPGLLDSSRTSPAAD